jgi:fructose-specific phosphotransferase system component IIB
MERKEKPMRKARSFRWAAAMTVFILLLAGGVALAEEMKMVGDVVKIEISGPDAKTAKATLKDTKTGELVIITVNDDLTLDKFKDHRIVVGDEIRCKYEVKDGKNVSKYFRKTAGC